MKVQGTYKPDFSHGLNASHVLQGIEKVIKRTQGYHRIWQALHVSDLAPHPLIVKNRFTRVAFDALCEKLILKNWQSQAQPGEQSGYHRSAEYW
jgi:hypothetical protein